MPMLPSFGRTQIVALVFAGLACAAHAQQEEARGPTGELSREIGTADRLIVSGVSGSLNIRSAPTLDGSILERAQAGAVFGNAGCQDRAGREWCALRFLDGSDRRGWAAAEYLAPSSVRTRAQNGEFDQIGRLDCRAAGEATWSRCEFGVTRSAHGAAALVIYNTDGTEALLLFDDRDVWLAREDADVGVASTRGAEVVTVAWDGSEIAVPLAALSAQ